MRHLTCEPDIEVIGASLLSIVDNLQSSETQPLLEKNGLIDIQPNDWYPCQNWLSAMNDLAQSSNATPNYVAIGMEVAKNVVLPPELESATLPEILEMWDTIYQMQHRGGDIGFVKVEKKSDTHYRTIHKHLYPDDLTYGLAYGWCRRFLPKGTQFKVEYEDMYNRLDLGDAETTTILIQW